MALVAALPHQATLVHSTTAYLVAPAPLDDGVAYLTVPRRNATPGVMARVAGDRLVVVRATGAKELVDGFCDSAAGCAAVGAPVGDGTDVVFGLPTDGGGGYVGRSGQDGRIRIVHSDEAGDSVPLYAAAGGRTVFVGTGGIAARTGKDPTTVLVPAASAAGVVRAVGASAGAVAWVARQAGNGPWTVGVRVGTAAPFAFTDVRRGVRIGSPAVTDDGTAVFAQRISAGPGRVQFQVVVLKAGVEQVLATSPVVPVADQRSGAARRPARHDRRLPAPRRRRRPVGGDLRDRPRHRHDAADRPQGPARGADVRPRHRRQPDRLGADRFPGGPVRPLARAARAPRAVGSRR